MIAGLAIPSAPKVTTIPEFKNLILSVMSSTITKPLLNGRVAYWGLQQVLLLCMILPVVIAARHFTLSTASLTIIASDLSKGTSKIPDLIDLETREALPQ